MATLKQDAVLWKQAPWAWGILGLSALLMLFIFNEGLVHLVLTWENREEYSHGFLIPFVVAFLIWQKKDALQRLQFDGTWAGVIIALFGLLLYVVGELSTLYVIVQYAFLIVIYGVALSLVGWKGFKIILLPLLILIFMIPLPNFILQGLSGQLQLISSQLGVWVIKAFGISVLLEGNVIDLGSYKLQVVEACSGLRYLFPLMTFGFITAYFYKAVFWKRAIIFLSSIPITILMNSFRIGVIGVTVEYWGQEMAEGFLHDFEGWVVFMACTGVLFLEMWLLTKIGKDKTLLREAFAIELPAKTPKGTPAQARPIPKPFVAGIIMLAIVTVVAFLLPQREEIQPMRKEFSTFPLAFNNWKGKEDRLEQIYVDTLKFEDYIIADFKNPNGEAVNFYVAYYGSQRKGESAHSPRSCIPGGGWKIEDISRYQVDGIKVNGNSLNVNRTLITLGDHKQLVYYWFQQRGRVITNEYLVKWYLFWDALTKNRTDGALVRLTAYVEPGQEISEADALLGDFISKVNPYLANYVPN
jgi:exosortase D (VPLPA-CTERM-specific)